MIGTKNVKHYQVKQRSSAGALIFLVKRYLAKKSRSALSTLLDKGDRSICCSFKLVLGG